MYSHFGMLAIATIQKQQIIIQDFQQGNTLIKTEIGVIEGKVGGLHHRDGQLTAGGGKLSGELDPHGNDWRAGCRTFVRRAVLFEQRFLESQF